MKQTLYIAMEPNNLNNTFQLVFFGGDHGLLQAMTSSSIKQGIKRISSQVWVRSDHCLNLAKNIIGLKILTPSLAQTFFQAQLKARYKLALSDGPVALRPFPTLIATSFFFAKSYMLSNEASFLFSYKFQKTIFYKRFNLQKLKTTYKEMHPPSFSLGISCNETKHEE